MTDLYRVFPYDAAAKSTEPGAALFVPAPYDGRIANPDLYHEWYFARDAAGAVAEYFARFARWQPATFSPQAKLPFAIARYALSSDRICDLNDTEILVCFGIVRPTDVTSANRRLTQAGRERSLTPANMMASPDGRIFTRCTRFTASGITRSLR